MKDIAPHPGLKVETEIKNLHRGRKATPVWGILLIVALLSTACAGNQPQPDGASLETIISGVELPSGWTPAEEPQTFSPDTLFDLVNGMADLYFAYGFQNAALARYIGPEESRMQIQIFQLSDSDDAYGLFTVSSTGQAADIGVNGNFDPGRRLAFWQDRYFVQIVAAQPVEDSTLTDLGHAISGALPAGGQIPDLVSSLPADGIVPGSVRFFHEEIAIQNWLWLGGSNLLGLSQDSDGVLAQYESDGASAQLLLITFANADQAEATRQALEANPPSGLVTTYGNDNALGAVFGDMDTGQAQNILKEALK